MKNFDSIKAMTAEEMARVIGCPNEMGMAEIPCDHSDSKNCYECCLEWLLAEEEED